MKIFTSIEKFAANITYSSSSGNKLEKAHPSDAGYDMQASCAENVTIQPGEVKSLNTGIRLNLPKGWEAQVRSRSGLCKKFGIMVGNSPGTIDPDYRGEVKVLLHNSGKEPYTVKAGDKIAQLVFSPVWDTSTEMVPETEIDKETIRGEKGFESTEEANKTENETETQSGPPKPKRGPRRPPLPPGTRRKKTQN